MKVQGHLMQAHFIEIHQVFAKTISLDTFLTEVGLFCNLFCFKSPMLYFSDISYYLGNLFCYSNLLLFCLILQLIYFNYLFYCTFIGKCKMKRSLDKKHSQTFSETGVYARLWDRLELFTLPS